MINWKTGKPNKTGWYLIYTYDDFYKKEVIKTRHFSTIGGWDYGDNFIKFWAELPNLPEEK